MDTLGLIEILVRIAWLAGAVAFVIGLARMNSPATARAGNVLSAYGMALAVGATAILILSRELLGTEKVMTLTPLPVVLEEHQIDGGRGNVRGVDLADVRGPLRPVGRQTGVMRWALTSDRDQPLVVDVQQGPQVGAVDVPGEDPHRPGSSRAK